MREELHRHSYIKSGLSDVLKNREFYLVYQPIFNNSANKIIFCEALLRWKHQGVNISSDESIPVAEQHGYIVEIGKWVLLQACDDAVKWESSDSICVNVSIIQLMQADFFDIVAFTLEQTSLSPHRLHFKITETVFAKKSIT